MRKESNRRNELIRWFIFAWPLLTIQKISYFVQVYFKIRNLNTEETETWFTIESSVTKRLSFLIHSNTCQEAYMLLVFRLSSLLNKSFGKFSIRGGKKSTNLNMEFYVLIHWVYMIENIVHNSRNNSLQFGIT